MLDPIIPSCGPRCDKCPSYIATQANDREALARIAKEWTEGMKRTFTADDILCDGCRMGGRLSAFCATCDIKLCATGRKHETCAHCDTYPCERIVAPQARQALDEIRAGLEKK